MLPQLPVSESSYGPLPIGRRAARVAVLGAVFICAACGLVYELALIALGSYLVGNDINQTSIVLSVFVASMGLGAMTAKRLQHRPIEAFAVVESLLALLGGLSVLALYAAFAWLDLYQPALVAFSVVIGGFIGAEIPLLMTLIQRIHRQEAGDAASDLFAADYIGALVGGLAFPFLLLPFFGQLQGALVVGVLNVLAALMVAGWLFGRQVGRRQRGMLAALFFGVLIALGTAGRLADDFEVSARQALYDDPIVTHERSAYQEIVLTQAGRRGDLRLYLNGDLQFSSVDEYRYHEALVHPAMTGRRERVLVLGGGDGLALREVLRYPDVGSVVLVELDPKVIAVARSDSRLARLNAGALDDPRVRVVTADAFSWLRTQQERFDVAIVDLTDPDNAATAKLYSVEFYTMLSTALERDARAAIQAGSPYFAPEAFWCVGATLEAAGLQTTPYQVEVPSFGSWGFHLAERTTSPSLRLPEPVPPALRFLDDATLAAAGVFPRDRQPRPVDASTLMRPKILDYQREAWRSY
ncbi:MAG: polyamine aminopropyltransferase [Actinomycetota bacterium]|nr:polyamine aminopropyltransferase [Actinomycetota bacterium]